MRPPGVFVHARALCESTEVGRDTKVWAFAHIAAGAVVGRACKIGESVFIESGAIVGDRVTLKNGVQIWDCVTLEDDVFVGPNATFTNDLRPRAYLQKDRSEFLQTLVQRGATIGASSTLICGATIGEFAFVAAGAVVLRDVPAHALVAGNPARQVGRVCWCAAALDETLTCGACGRSYAVDDSGSMHERS